MTTLQEQNLLDAALEVSGYPTMGTMSWDRFDHAVQAYRATQAKDCRPPDGADSGTYWLTNETLGDGVATRVGWWWPATSEWVIAGHLVKDSARTLGEIGWTVDSECRFGETGVEATVDEVDALIDGVLADDALCGRNGINRAGLRVLVSKSTHFRASKLEISDEEIMDMMRETEWFRNTAFVASVENVRDFARAVIAKVGGEK